MNLHHEGMPYTVNYIHFVGQFLNQYSFVQLLLFMDVFLKYKHKINKNSQCHYFCIFFHFPFKTCKIIFEHQFQLSASYPSCSMSILGRDVKDLKPLYHNKEETILLPLQTCVTHTSIVGTLLKMSSPMIMKHNHSCKQYQECSHTVPRLTFSKGE